MFKESKKKVETKHSTSLVTSLGLLSPFPPLRLSSRVLSLLPLSCLSLSFSLPVRDIERHERVG